MAALLDGLASDSPVPASGSAAAAVIAMASALLEKVARLSMAKWATADAALEEAHALRLRAEELVEADANSYMAYVEAIRSAKNVHGKARERAIAPIARLAAETVDLADVLAANGNPSLRADAMVAATLAAAAATAAARLVTVNLSGVRDSRSTEADRVAREANDKATGLGTLLIH